MTYFASAKKKIGQPFVLKRLNFIYRHLTSSGNRYKSKLLHCTESPKAMSWQFDPVSVYFIHILTSLFVSSDAPRVLTHGSTR